MSPPRALAALAAAALLGLAPRIAHASTVLELFGGLGGEGGLNARAIGAGADAAYFNPALLADADDTIEVSFFGASEGPSIGLDPRPASADIAPSIGNAWVRRDTGSGVDPLPTHPLPTKDIAARGSDSPRRTTTSWFGFGLARRLLGDKLVLGFQMMLPVGAIQKQNVFYVDEREQYFSNGLHFELLGDRLQMSTFAFGLGSRLCRGFSVGVGMTAAIQTDTTNPIFVPNAADYSKIFLDPNLSVAGSVTPHLGLAWELLSGLRLTATLHAASSVTVNGKNDIKVANTAPALEIFTLVQGWEPLNVSAGLTWDAYTAEDARFSLVGSAIWRDWSGYLDRHGEKPVDGWRDTLSVAFGGRYKTGALGFALDGSYVPSPVPDQTGRSSYVDNARVVVAGSARLSGELLGARVHGSVGLQVTRLLPRSVTKDPHAANPVRDEYPDNSVDPQISLDTRLAEAQGLQTNNPGYPGFSSAGWLLGGGITLGVDL